jgi:hypothetical protein
MRTDKRGAFAHEDQRTKLINANKRFVAALDRALSTGGETIEAMQCTFRPKGHLPTH